MNEGIGPSVRVRALGLPSGVLALLIALLLAVVAAQSTLQMRVASPLILSSGGASGADEAEVTPADEEWAHAVLGRKSAV